ncbi:MAG: hypothetical protein UY81_C0001G0001 [Candidatus Giovannonibacteria bacterium GW2011_GWA2_53_7]|uniref:DUF218 domain-containing protein n=1 Tax=Candidatus Giovannonibacteria bacterium GW2011_GWA2_53_7 TaxID=1618650 RepID=A0A0G1Y224_9BACT|nr:MAG: hypothetical protein UY81_C0001G0001 [Candidatus Giovannonibacteria bacterium GW2011_GWA2_53_7]
MKLLKRFLSFKKRLFYVMLAGFVCLVLLISYADHAVETSAFERTYDDVSEIPQKKVALLLGSNKYISDGRENLFYTYRIDATVALYKAGKMEFVLISGDNGTAEYSEPELMQADLVAEGIPKERIYLDYAGFRTWDSIIRANKVFLEEDFIIISQSFHNKRALYIATSNGIDAIAFNAKDVPVSRSPRIWLRERLARVKVMIDVWRHQQPKFLGETIVIK